MLWTRHATLDRKWHAGVDRNGHFASYCNGNWGTNDPEIVQSANPPHEDRCEACERQRIDVVRTARALGDLRDSMTYDEYPSAHELNDVGGEG